MLTALLVSAALGSLHADFVDLFEAHEFAYSGGGYQNELFRYRLFIPEGASPENRFPLIVWLHGKGEAGDDNILHLTWLDTLVFKPPWERKRYPYFFLAVQCPASNPRWVRALEAGDDMVNVAAAILTHVLQNKAIDPNRVVLAGISSGGVGCWELAVRYPEFFAGISPMAGFAPDDVQRLAKIPVWAFHSEHDGAIPPYQVRRAIHSLQEVGATAKLTEIPTASHECWISAFEEYYILDWLLNQKRGQIGAPPGTIPLHGRIQSVFRGWQWQQLFVQGTVCGIAAFGCYAVYQRLRVAKVN